MLVLRLHRLRQRSAVGRVLTIGVGGPGPVVWWATVVARARWSVFKIAYMAAFPLLLFAGVLLQVDNLSLSGRLLTCWGTPPQHSPSC